MTLCFCASGELTGFCGNSTAIMQHLLTFEKLQILADRMKEHAAQAEDPPEEYPPIELFAPNPDQNASEDASLSASISFGTSGQDGRALDFEADNIPSGETSESVSGFRERSQASSADTHALVQENPSAQQLSESSAARQTIADNTNTASSVYRAHLHNDGNLASSLNEMQATGPTLAEKPHTESMSGPKITTVSSYRTPFKLPYRHMNDSTRDPCRHQIWQSFG